MKLGAYDVKPHVFEVGTTDLQKTRIIPLPVEQTLVEDEVMLRVDKFAFTANNISYGIAGDTLGYWRFFPSQGLSATDPSGNKQWGRLPVMGYADVVASNNNQIRVGERVWGFMPMATHVKILAGKVNTAGFSDISQHRDGLAPFYAAFERISHNPHYRVENEDFDILVRGLFTTSWLVDDFMVDNQYFGASQYLITSASSKTSIALAFAIKARAEMTTIGITSAENMAFVESLACYDHVISYGQVALLDNTMKSILVDMAGSKTTLSAIHQHFSAQLCYSCRVGVTHHEDLASNGAEMEDILPGVKPIFFFAPTQLKKRAEQWGSKQTMQQIASSLQQYIVFCRSFMTIKHTTARNNLDTIYQGVLFGRADAAVGQIMSL